MLKPQYEGYCTEQATVLVREKFGGANVYAKNAQQGEELLHLGLNLASSLENTCLKKSTLIP